LGKIRFFRYPSLLGGLWLFWLFSPNRRLNSMFSACRRAFSARRFRLQTDNLRLKRTQSLEQDFYFRQLLSHSDNLPHFP
jgi:hypothetical protein